MKSHLSVLLSSAVTYHHHQHNDISLVSYLSFQSQSTSRVLINMYFLYMHIFLFAPYICLFFQTICLSVLYVIDLSLAQFLHFTYHRDYTDCVQFFEYPIHYVFSGQHLTALYFFMLNNFILQIASCHTDKSSNRFYR